LERVEGSRQKRASIEAELVGLGERLLGLEDTRAAEVAVDARLKDEHAKAGARLSTLEEMERSFENVTQGARSIMQKAGTNGIHGLMADVIDTNPGFERALEAVMGERLQYVIVESHAQGVEAIEYLKAHAGGRSSFIPVRDSRPALSPVSAGAPGHANAKELRSEVMVKDGYSHIVDCLLGDTLVVEDLDIALDMWRQNGMYKTLVTMDGEVVSPEGVITGGKTNGVDPGVFQRRSEVKAIRKTVSGLETSLREAEERLDETVREIDNTRALADDCRDRLHSAELESVNLEAELNRQEEEDQRLNVAREALASEIADAALRLAEISTSKTRLNAEGDSLEQARADNESRTVALATEIASIADEKEALSAALTGLKISLATARERYGRINAQIGEKESLLRDIENRTLLKTDETAHGTKEITEKLVVVESHRARVEELLALIDGAKAEEIKRRESLSGLTERLERIEAELRTLKATSAGLQVRSTELTLELKEMELNIRHLKERIIERYGVEIASVETPDQGSQEDIGPLAEKREELRRRIESMGEVSLSALEEYNELESRHTFLFDQRTDLQKSVDSIHAAITRINRVTRERFARAFEEINAKFKENFPRLFSGGRAELRLSDSEDVLESGIEIVAQPPGKRLQNITLLSGGEKALTAIALIFSIFLVKPSPFCMLDEVDAPLDDANIDKFNNFVNEMSATSQFLLITHNKRTMEMVDSLYGITMEEPGVSKVISVSF
jgi:chromosome segregation protein